MMRSGATIIHGTNAPGALLREDARWWEMPPPQTKRQCVHAEPPISSETTDTKPRSRYRRFQPLWEPTGVVGPILPSPRFAGEGFQRCAGTDPGYHPLAGAYLPARLLAVLLSHCCRAGGGDGCVVPCTVPWDPCVPVGMLGWGGGGGWHEGVNPGKFAPSQA